MDEFTVKAATSSSSKKFNVFKLHKDDNVTWTEAKMRRENDYQPWQIKFGSGRTGRRFKAIKEGGVGDNTSYFVFYKPNDKNDTYEVCSIDEWYSVSATQRYKTLTAEEAEQKFEQRHKMLNLFSVMHLKKNGENGEAGESGRSGSGDSKSFKVSELDDWDHSGDDEASGDDDDDEDGEKKKRRKKAAKKEKDDPDDAPDEAKEESDEGDFEQREVDYMSDTSSDSSEEEEAKDETDVKGIAEEEALRDLLSTDDEEDAEHALQKGPKPSSNNITLGTVEFKQDPEDNGSDDSSDSDDYDVDEEKMDSMFNKKGLPTQLTSIKQEIKQEMDVTGTSGSRAIVTNRQQPSVKRKAGAEVSTPAPQPPPKRPCTNEATSSASSNSLEKIVEDLVRKYLSRKPMALKILLKDIKSKLKKMEGIPPSEIDNNLVQTIAKTITKIKPEKQKINNMVYFSLKS